MDIRYHGHACFELTDGDTRILVDPFLKPNNPSAVATADEVDATHVLITHGHADHIADAVAVATRNSAPAVAIVEAAATSAASSSAGSRPCSAPPARPGRGRRASRSSSGEWSCWRSRRCSAR